MPAGLGHGDGPDDVLVDAPLTRRPLDDLIGGTGEVTGHAVLEQLSPVVVAILSIESGETEAAWCRDAVIGHRVVAALLVLRSHEAGAGFVRWQRRSGRQCREYARCHRWWDCTHQD